MDIEDSDQIGRISRLIKVFDGRTSQFVVLSCAGSLISKRDLGKQSKNKPDNWKRHEKTCLCRMRTTKAQISAFVVRCLDSIIPLVSMSEILSFNLLSVAAQAGLCLTLTQTAKTGFLVTRLKWKRLIDKTGRLQQA